MRLLKSIKFAELLGGKLPAAFVKRIICFVILFSFGVCAEPFNHGEHSRRAAAELLVIAGDIREIQRADIGELRRKGLKDRIHGSLAAIDILLRLSDQQNNQPVQSYLPLVMSIKQKIDSTDFLSAAKEVDKLVHQYPLQLPVLRVTNTSDASDLHNALCQSCHTGATLKVERPAFDLFEQASSISETEMFARLLVGVRGDRVTGIDNPLTDIQIIGLLQLYTSN